MTHVYYTELRRLKQEYHMHLRLTSVTNKQNNNNNSKTGLQLSHTRYQNSSHLQSVYTWANSCTHCSAGVTVLMWDLHCFDYCSFVINLKSQSVSPILCSPASVLSWIFRDHCNSSDNLGLAFLFLQNAVEGTGLMKCALNLYINVWEEHFNKIKSSSPWTWDNLLWSPSIFQ